MSLLDFLSSLGAISYKPSDTKLLANKGIDFGLVVGESEEAAVEGPKRRQSMTRLVEERREVGWGALIRTDLGV